MEVEIFSQNPNTFKVISVCMQTIGATHFILACAYDWFYAVAPASVSPIHSAYGYKLKFLTFWNALTQATYFSFCVLIDIFVRDDGRPGDRNLLVRIKDYVECSIAFPIALFVSTTFWGLMAIDRELVLPKALDPYFPGWLNHMMHTNIMVFQLLEFVTSRRVFPKRMHALIGMYTFQTLYLIWMVFVHYKSGVWAYPIFDQLNLIAKIVFFMGCYGTGTIFFLIGETFHKFLWGDYRGNCETVKTTDTDDEGHTQFGSKLTPRWQP